jgi:hypothetical protein
MDSLALSFREKKSACASIDSLSPNYFVVGGIKIARLSSGSSQNFP